MADTHEVKRLRNGWAVFGPDGNPCTVAYKNRAHASRHLDRIKPKPVVKRRNCICCTTPFDSVGFHNRMCDRCRLRLAGLDRNMVGC